MAPERAIPLDQGAGALGQVSRVRLSQRAHARPQLAADVGLEQQLGEAGGAEHLVRPGAACRDRTTGAHRAETPRSRERAPGNRPAESASLCGGWAQSRSRAKRWWRSA